MPSRKPAPETPPVAEASATQLAEAAPEAPAEMTPAPEVAEIPEAPLASTTPEAPPVWPEDVPATSAAEQAEAETEPEPEQEAAVPEAPAATAAGDPGGLHGSRFHWEQCPHRGKSPL